ncbi:MAG: hypothetical protein E7613_04210 [Ruminococcaceae bacterium]|nr:hypothetical protein [Oscillospiraceae bacterium]
MNNFIFASRGTSDREALQTAILQAKESGHDKVVIPEGEWQIDEPILLPSNIHIILDGATVVAKDVAFRNENLYSTFGCMREGKQKSIVINGKNSAKIKGGILIHNADNIRIEDLAFEDGGVTLSFCHDVRVRNIITNTVALHLMNGCHQIIAHSLIGETALQAISRRAAVGDFMNWDYDYNFDVFEDSPEICFGVFEGVSGKVTLFSEGEMYNIRGEAEMTAENGEFFNIYNMVIER